MNRISFHAIEVIPGNDCNCPLSKLAGKRVLYSEVLELFTSSNLSCGCTFKHFDDRRHKFDRRRFDSDDLTSSSHNRTRPYGRRAVDIHNRSRDQFAEQRLERTLSALQQAAY